MTVAKGPLGFAGANSIITAQEKKRATNSLRKSLVVEFRSGDHAVKATAPARYAIHNPHGYWNRSDRIARNVAS
jgi:hypothetical protein